MNKKFFMMSGNGTPTPPVGADLFYWYGLEGANWTEKNDTGNKYTLTKNDDNLSIERTDSSGGIATLNIQTSETYSSGAGKTLYMRYEVVSIDAGSITSMISNLEDIATQNGNISARINITSFAVDGLHLVNSPGTTDGQTGYAPKVEFRSNSALFEIKIYELYYL